MGAAAAIEGRKPVDASDITASGSLDVARNEIIMLRTTLGKYATQAGFSDNFSLDASDLVQGTDEGEDFNRCVAEIRHIRECLRLSTAGARRATRATLTQTDMETLKFDEKKGGGDDDDDRDDDSDDDSDDPDRNAHRK
jgi:hypothetical protein